MSQIPPIIDPFICPLCKKKNECATPSKSDAANACWCQNPNIKFPSELIEKIARDAQGKACICQSCALGYQTSQAKSKKPSSEESNTR